MRHKLSLVVVLFYLVCGGVLQGNELPAVTLVEGKNEVFISVVNDGTIPIKSLDAIVNAEDLPSGIKFIKTARFLDVPEKSREKFVLEILVKDGLHDMTFQLPILLRDADGREWTFTALATIEDVHPKTFKLLQNEPNPFNPSTTIRYELASRDAKPTTLTIFNVMGQKVRTLVNEPQIMGSYAVRWDGRDDRGQKLSSGLYIYRLRSGNNISTRKMMFIE
ncbi:MAG TPA: T9SS type A sorting domain-containing protein [bacterium]|nr:T9SS type A sorting domain-containing protein [bacterium]